ncbi:MAG: Ig-like domain-containing protein, partial [Ruminococcus sp.]|nr:Ig-like domain-containing protein [Ruminococcus sp.]
PNEQGQKKIGDAWAGAIADQVKEMNDAGEGNNTTKIVPTLSVCLDAKEINLTAGSYRRRLYADVQMRAATVDTVIWESSDPTVASVDIDGLVTPLAEGECTITATTLSGGFSSTCKVNVAPAVSEENELATALKDTFTLPERWVGGGYQGLGDNGIHIWFPGQGNSTQYDTRIHYPVEKEFKLTTYYTVAGNEASFTNYTYSSFAFAGLEMRLAYGAKTIELYHNSTLLGKWTHSYEGGMREYNLHYSNGNVKVIRNNEIVVEATVPYSELPATSPVKFYSGEFNRYAQTHSIKLETINFSNEYFVESSPIDTDKKVGFEPVIDGFDADNWTVTADSSSITNGAIKAPNGTTFIKYNGNNLDVSKGFQMQLDFNWNNYTRYYGESIYYTIGDVAFRIRNAYDSTQARNYPLYLCVYENAVFNETTGAFESGDIVATMISDATGQINQSSNGILGFMNAT